MIKTMTFAILHFSVAFTVAYLLTGSALIGGLVALVEPAINMVVFYFHEKHGRISIIIIKAMIINLAKLMSMNRHIAKYLVCDRLKHFKIVWESFSDTFGVVNRDWHAT